MDQQVQPGPLGQAVEGAADRIIIAPGDKYRFYVLMVRWATDVGRHVACAAPIEVTQGTREDNWLPRVTTVDPP